MTNINSVSSSTLDKYYSSTSATSAKSTTTTTTTTSGTSTTSTSTTSTTIGTGSVARYISSTSTSQLDAKTLFKKLSIDVGSDGKNITEDQLNSYISKAQSGKVSVSSDELNALKDIQKNWDTLSNGSSSITYSDMAGNTDMLTSMAGTTATTSSTSALNLTQSSTDEVYSYLINSALSSGSSNNTGSNLSSMLKTLLTGTTDENDDANAELVAQLTNLIAESKTKSTISTEA